MRTPTKANEHTHGRPGPWPGPSRHRTRARAHPECVDVHVIAGALGSGKTTLLQRLLSHTIELGARPTVVMSQLGDTDVDGIVLQGQTGRGRFDLRSVLSGCSCCDASLRLTEEVQAAVTGACGPLFVEATGVASVRDVAGAVARAISWRNGGRRGRLASVIVVVDARRFRLCRGHSGTSADDIQAADTILVSRVDEVTADRLTSVKSALRALNPRAGMFSSALGGAAPEAILDAAPLPASSAVARPDRAPPDTSSGFESVTAQVLGMVDVRRLGPMLARQGARVARVKGFVRTTERWGLQELQWVPGALEVRPQHGATHLRPHLVVTGRDVDWDRFATDLDRCIEMPVPAARAVP